MSTICRTAFLLLGCTLLGGCAVAPPYVRPAEPHLVMDTVPVLPQLDARGFETQWWKQFEDPMLDELVAAALSKNRDLRMAFASWRASRALRDDGASNLYPAMTGRASAQTGKAILPGLTTARVETQRHDLGLDSRWELDLFGRLRHQLAAADARSETALADWQQLQVSLAAEMADAYGALRAAQWLQRIAREHLSLQQQTLQLASERHDAGFGPQLDLLRAQARLAATRASLPEIQAGATRARHRIAVLLGLRPDQLAVDLSPRRLPAIDTVIRIGDPSELLRRRPDIRSAERQLAASTAELGAATADLFPRVSLTGFLGFTAARGSQIGSLASRAWSASPAISWNAFDMGSVRARLRAAEAQADQALAHYEQTVLLAVEEAANAFSDYGHRHQQLGALIQRHQASQDAARQAAIQYREGIADHLVLLDAQREQLAAEEAQANAEAQAYRGIVAIYKALGGGWQPI